MLTFASYPKLSTIVRSDSGQQRYEAEASGRLWQRKHGIKLWRFFKRINFNLSRMDFRIPVNFFMKSRKNFKRTNFRHMCLFLELGSRRCSFKVHKVLIKMRWRALQRPPKRKIRVYFSFSTWRGFFPRATIFREALLAHWKNF